MFHSTHEAYAVMKEELEESEEAFDWCKSKLDYIWELTKVNKDADNNELKCLKSYATDLAVEAIQIAAMAQKTIDSMSKEG